MDLCHPMPVLEGLWRIWFAVPPTKKPYWTAARCRHSHWQPGKRRATKCRLEIMHVSETQRSQRSDHAQTRPHIGGGSHFNHVHPEIIQRVSRLHRFGTDRTQLLGHRRAHVREEEHAHGEAHEKQDHVGLKKHLTWWHRKVSHWLVAESSRTEKYNELT